MALTFVAFASNGGNAQNPTCPIPTGTAVGDLMIAYWTTGAAVHTNPSGWTDELQTGTSSLITYVIWKVAVSGDLGTSPTFAQGGTTPTRVSIVSLRGDFDPADPIDAVGFNQTTTTSTISSPSRSMPFAGYVLDAAGVRGATAYTSTPPAGHVEIFDQTTSSGSPAKANTMSYDGASGTLDLVTAGTSIGGQSFTANASVASGQQHAHNIVVKQLNTGPIDATFVAVPTVTLDYPGPLSAPITNLPLYQSHRGGNDILPPQSMQAYTDPVNLNFSLEADCFICSTGGGFSGEDLMVLCHDSDLTVLPYYESDGTTALTSGSIYTTTRTQWDGYRVPDPLGGTKPFTATWQELAEYARANGRMCSLESKHSGAVQPIIDSILGRGLKHNVLANSFTYSHCTDFAAAGLHAMWITTSFATNSAATVAAAGIEWVAWQAGTANFSTFLADAHAAGLKVCVYTIDTTTSRDSYVAQGVDMISTDRPDIVFPTMVGSLNLSGSGTQSLSGTVTATLNLSGTGTLTTPTRTPALAQPLGLSGVGAMTTPTRTPAFTQPIGFSGAGTLTFPTQVPTPIQSLNTSGSGTLTTPTSTPAVAQTLAASGNGTMGLTAGTGYAGSLGLTGAGTLTGSGSPKAIQTWAATGAGTMVGAGSYKAIQTLSTSGAGTLTVPTRTPGLIRTFALSGAGTAVNTGSFKAIQTLARTGAGTADWTAGAQAYSGTLALTGVGTLSGQIVFISLAETMALSGSGEQSYDAVVAVLGTLANTGSGTIVLEGTSAEMRDIKAVLSTVYGHQFKIESLDGHALVVRLND